MAQRSGVNAIEFAGFDDLGTNGWKTLMERELRGLDVKVQARVLDRGMNTPPGSPAAGAAYIVGASPTGAWAGKANNLTRWNEHALEWEFWAPKSGWRAYVVDESRSYEWTGSAWDLEGVEKREVPDARAFGAAGTGAGDDTTPVAGAISATPLVQEFPVTAFSNPRGAKATPSGVAHNRASGVGRVYNPRKHEFMPFFGQETLQHWFGLFAPDANANWDVPIAGKKIVFSGDSVTFGVGGTYGGITAICNILARQRGYGGVSCVNRGQSGEYTAEWVSTYLAGDLAENPDLLVLRWGANDPGNGRTVDQFLADLRSGLATIRATKTPAQLSILLMTPTSMNDVPNGRTQVFSEQINDGIRQAARDYVCAFIDTYSLFQNSHNAAGVWMDSVSYGSPPANYAIHPLDQMYESISGAIAEMIFPYGRTTRTNAIHNHSLVNNPDSVVDSADALEDYAFAGIDIRRINGDANGGPHNGIAITMKQADGAAIQWSLPVWGKTAGIGISCRLNADGVWSPWLGASGDAAPWLDNSWANWSGAVAYATWQTTMEGRLVLDGVIQPGSIASGVRAMQVPADYRPGAIPGVRIYSIATSAGPAEARINSAGELTLHGLAGGVTWVSLSGISWKIG